MEQQHENHPVLGMPLRGILLLCGIYTFIWGAFFRWFGEALINCLAMGETVQAATTIYGTLGMVVGACIFLAAFYPLSWIYLILAGIVGKLGSSIWFLVAYQDLVGWNKRSVFHLVFNEWIWLIPLGIILYKAKQVKEFLRTYE